MNILEALNNKFTGPVYEADSDTTSVDGVYKITFYRKGYPEVFDSMYVKARMTDSGVATEPAN
jgi:hypothetical protein